MLIIKVWGLPAFQLEDDLRLLHEHIVGGATQLPWMDIKNEKEIFVWFPSDLMKYGLGSQILVEISTIGKELPTDRSKRDHLAWNIGAAVKDQYPKARVYSKVAPSGGALESRWFSDD